MFESCTRVRCNKNPWILQYIFAQNPSKSQNSQFFWKSAKIVKNWFSSWPHKCQKLVLWGHQTTKLSCFGLVGTLKEQYIPLKGRNSWFGCLPVAKSTYKKILAQLKFSIFFEKKNSIFEIYFFKNRFFFFSKRRKFELGQKWFTGQFGHRKTSNDIFLPFCCFYWLVKALPKRKYDKFTIWWPSRGQIDI